MPRRILNLATAVSLLLCVASLAWLIRSCWVEDVVQFATITADGANIRDTEWVVHSGAASVLIARSAIAWNEDQTGVKSMTPGRRLDYGSSALGGAPSVALWHRFEVSRETRGVSVIGVEFPIWLLILLFAATPAARVYRAIRRNRSPGHCRHCGYDLRATPDRCPECGKTA